MFRRKDEGAPDAATDASPATEVQVPPAAQGQTDKPASDTGSLLYGSAHSASSSTTNAGTAASGGMSSGSSAYGSGALSSASTPSNGNANAYTSPYRAPGLNNAGSTGSAMSGSNVTELSGRSGASSSRFGETRPTTGSTSMDKSANKPAGKNRILTVGNDILMKGEINSCDRIVIEGAVDATLKEVHTMEIAESGSFKGMAEVEEAEISGTVEGDLTVRGRLIIYATGKVTGKISYGEIEIERGGQLTGEIKTVGASASGMNKAAA